MEKKETTQAEDIETILTPAEPNRNTESVDMKSLIELIKQMRDKMDRNQEAFKQMEKKIDSNSETFKQIKEDNENNNEVLRQQIKEDNKENNKTVK